MKKTFFVLLALLPMTFLNAQKIRVLSENTGEPVENVAIFNTTRERAAITDQLGFTPNLTFLDTDTLVFQHSSYVTVIYPYTEAIAKRVIFLSKRNILIDEFVISASKSKESKQMLPYKVSILEERDLLTTPAQTAADLLTATGNIMVQKTQAGGGSPILRGFEANKVLLVVDGVRMNNAIYRSGHLQNSITIDNAVLERTEVIFGPSSLIYGSDALGGVIHYFTRDVKLAEDQKMHTSGNAYAQYATATKGVVGHLDMNLASQKFGSLTSITYKDFGEIRMGSNRNRFFDNWGKNLHYVDQVNGVDSTLANPNELIQKNTGYSQLDIIQKFKYAPTEYNDLVVNLQLSTSSDIHRMDKLNDYSSDGNLKYAEYYYGPQDRFLASVKNVNKNDNSLFTNATTILAYQRINEERVSRRFRLADKLFQKETVNVLSANVDLLKVWNANRKLNYGYDLIYNHVGSGAHYLNITTDERRPAETRYPSGGSHTVSSSLYGSYKHIVNEHMVFNGGLRYNVNYMQSVFNSPVLPFDSIRIVHGAITGSASLVYHPTPDWQINLILSTGYRNPNVDDYGKIRAKDEYILVPNNELKPEYTYNAEIAVSRVLEGFIRIDVAGYYTLIDNAIVRTEYSLNGQDSLVYDGEMYRISTNYNANRALIYGASVNVLSDFDRNIQLRGSFNYTRGWNVSDDVPLGHIPPVFGRVSLDYDFRKFRFESYVNYNGWKFAEEFSPYGEDNESEALLYGYPSWWTFNINTTYRLTTYLDLQLALENIFDQFYKPFASGVSAPGRNIVLTLRTAF
jgi:hemoglobin/transferrin/lactoferrin receptor protein